MRTGEPTGDSTAPQTKLHGISWWSSALLGLFIGTTLTWIRTQRNFFFAGAAILAVIIVLVGVRTIKRRKRFPQIAEARTSWTYALWTVLLLILAGPVQLVYVADDITELSIKSLVLSIGFALGIHEVDRALVKGSKVSQTS